MTDRTSPWLAEWHERIERDPAQVEAFWQDVATRGTPIVEGVGDDDARVRVTFVFRDGAHERRNIVCLLRNAAIEPERYLMHRIAGTDIWHWSDVFDADMRETYSFSIDDPSRDVLAMPLEEQLPYMRERAAAWVPDPHNPSRLHGALPGMVASVIALPRAVPQPWADARGGVPRGDEHFEQFDMLGRPQMCWTYAPPGFEAMTAPLPLIVLFDGFGYRQAGAKATFDNLIADGRIPPSVCMLLTQMSRMTELAANDDYADALVRDVVVDRARSRFRATDDPARTVVGGASLGGLMAAHCGLRHSDVFGNVLSQSGSYWWGDPPEALTHAYEASPKLPLRWHMDVGRVETTRVPNGGPNMVEANRRLRDVLLAKGYDVRSYDEFAGGHDHASWRGTLADGLIALLGDA